MTLQIPYFFLLLITLNYCSAILKQPIPDATNSSSSLVVQGCEQEWDHRIFSLTSAIKDQLSTDKIVVGGTKANGYFLISPDIVADCKSRISIGEFLYRVYEDLAIPEDLEFAREHSTEITNALRAVWDSPIFGHDKYNLLNYSGLRDDDIKPIIATELKTNPYNSGIMYVTVERPQSSPIKELEESLQKCVDSKDYVRSIYLLIALNLATNDTQYLSRLNSIADLAKLSGDEKKKLRNLHSKLARHKKISYADVESLGLPIEE